MSKTMSWPARAMYILVALALAVGLTMIAAPTSSGDPAKLSEWDDVSTPSKTDKVILPESDILSFDVGPDGEVIYAIAYVAGDCALLKSEDGGVTWDDITDEVTEEGLDAFYLVSVSPTNADFVIVAGADKVIGSNDGGGDFSDAKFPAGVGNIACLDVSPEADGAYNIAVGTDAGEIYRYKYTTKGWPIAWADATDYAGWSASTAVTSVAFSPAFAGDDTILAITTDGSKTYQQSGLWGTTKAWNSEAGSPFPAAVKIVDAPPLGPMGHTGIALPSNFTGYSSGLRHNWVYVNYDVDNSVVAPASFKAELDEIGEVFRVKGSAVKYAGIRCARYDTSETYPLMASISMTGEIEDGSLMVGLGVPTACCAGIQVYRTTMPIDYCCPQWSAASKPPTGQSHALVAYTPDGEKAYATTAGDPNNPTPPDESAFSVSEVEVLGKYWNQLSLIDTNIDELTDVAVNPACGTIYLFSVNDDGCGCDSVWSSVDDGKSYMRIFCKDLGGSPEVGLIRLAPEEEEEVLAVYLVDQGTKKLYWNDNSGITKWTSHKVAPLSDIVDLAVEAEDTVYAVASNGKVSMSEKHGAPGSWSSAKSAKLASGEGGHTIAVVDGNVLVGGDSGSVGYSDDSAASFSRLGKKNELGSAGLVHVVFDSYFEDNATVYAAVTGGDQGVWRWVIDDSTSWKDLKATSQDYFGVALDNADGNPKTDADNGGVLYAVYADGMARWLSPAKKPSAANWDYLTNGAGGIDDNGFISEPSALKICGCLTEESNSKLWAVDAGGYDLADGNDNLFVYEDCLAKAGVTLSEVADGATIPSDPCICENEDFILEWEELCNSSTYELEIALDEDFDFVVEEYTPDDEYQLVEEGDLDCNETYYWRVRVIEADGDAETIRSWWSEKWSFMVEAGPGGAIDLTAPDDGAANVAISGIGFTWTSVAEATGYDWVLSPNADLSSAVETKSLTGTAYTYTGTLEYSTTYFWQVTAMKDGSMLSKSSLSTFTTVAEAPAPVWTCPQCGLTFDSEAALKAHIAEAHAPPPPPTTPAWVWVVIGIGAVLVIVVIVLIFRTRRV